MAPPGGFAVNVTTYLLSTNNVAGRHSLKCTQHHLDGLSLYCQLAKMLKINEWAALLEICGSYKVLFVTPTPRYVSFYLDKEITKNFRKEQKELLGGRTNGDKFQKIIKCLRKRIYSYFSIIYSS